MTSFLMVLCAFLFGGNFGSNFGDFSCSTRYLVTDLGVLPDHQSSRAFSINSDGVVVGESTQGFLTQHAFVWKNGEMKAVASFGEGQTVALGVSNEGPITGTHSGVDGVCHGWILPADSPGLPVDIGTLGGNFCASYAVNDKGVVVGCSHDASNENHAFIWHYGLMTNLFPHSDFSVATDINSIGQVVGFFQNNSGVSVAFLREASGKITELGTLGGEHSSALGLNDLAQEKVQVVGSSYLATGYRHAFIFENGKMRDLGTLPKNRVGENGEQETDTTSEAFEINNHGVVIGESVSLGAPARPFVWSAKNGMQDLQSLILDQNFTRDFARQRAENFHLQRVTDINDAGQIVGWGYFGPADKKGDGGPSHAVLLTPITFPQALHTIFTEE